MTETAFSSKRVVKLALLFACSILFPAAAGVIRRVRLDHLIVWCFLSATLFLCLALYLANERLHGDMPMGKSNDYSLFSLVYLACLFASCASSLMPLFTVPVMAFSALCNGAFQSKLGAVLGVYFAALSGLLSEGGADVTGAYVLLALAGVFLTELFMQPRLRAPSCVIAASVSVIIPVCCGYLHSHEPDPRLIMLCLAGSAATIAVMSLIPWLRRREAQAEEISLTTIMDEHFHLRKDIKRYSTVDYEHALRVSSAAAYLADGIGADGQLAAAGGFYYRIGKLEGDPFIENGVRIAQQNCFPQRLVAILEEYNGEKRLPGSVESAIVQIADMIVTKFDLLDKDTFSTTWNRDIVIYQSMNEKSAQGLYDKSGLTMNQFLTLRERLVQYMSNGGGP